MKSLGKFCVRFVILVLLLFSVISSYAQENQTLDSLGQARIQFDSVANGAVDSLAWKTARIVGGLTVTKQALQHKIDSLNPANKISGIAAKLRHAPDGAGNTPYSKVVVYSGANHTPGGNESIKLNSTFRVGLSKSIKVYPGDKIDASVYSYYSSSSGYTKTPLASMLPVVAAAFGGYSGVIGDPGAIFNSVTNTAGNAWIAGLSPDEGPTRPSAYLNYILFDKDYLPIGGMSQPVAGTPNTPMLVSLPTITAPELGYVFIYLSYDNATGGDVFFDDLKITVQESPVIEVNNYYPFGLKSYTWLRPGETENAYLFQGKELIAQTGWHDFGSRMYWSDLGRWFAADPKSQFSSPYLAMGNAPTLGKDPDGKWFIVDDIVASLVGGASNVFSHWHQITSHGFSLSKFGGAFTAGAAGGEVSIYAGPEAGFVVAGALQNFFNNGGNFKHWNWQEFVNAGSSVLGAQEAGLKAAQKAGITMAEEEGAAVAEKEGGGFFVTKNGVKHEAGGLFETKLGDTKVAKFFNEAKLGDFKVGGYVKEGLKGGRDALLQDYGKSGRFSLTSAGLGFGSAGLAKYATSGISGDFQDMFKNLHKNYTSSLFKSIITGEKWDPSDMVKDASFDFLTPFGVRLGTN